VKSKRIRKYDHLIIWLVEEKKKFKPEEKASIALEMLREEKTITQIAAEHEIHPNVLCRWKAEALENLHTIFSKETNEAEELRQQYEAERTSC